MIISRTPFRVSFAGGGSDLKQYYSQNGGAVLSTTINKYVYLSMHPYFNSNKIFLKYSKSELVDSIGEIEHRIIRQVFSDYNIMGVDLSSSADIPAGTGLGSSSAFTAGLISLCNAYINKYMSKEDIAKYACEIEIEKLKEPIGKQDQYASAIGGINFFAFNPDNSVSIEKVILGTNKLKTLQNRLMIYYLGETRSASKILIEQNENIKNDKRKVKFLKSMVDLAYSLKKDLCNNNIDTFGEILDTGWNYKKELTSTISNTKVDHYYNLARKNGAVGGKLLGAGGSGFLLFYVPEGKQEQIKIILNELKQLQFEFDSNGTTIIY